MDTYYIHEVNKKISIAKKLNNGEIGGSYFEAILIVSSILSATASILWPGENIDRKRFVELLIRYNQTDDDFSNISLPILNESRILTKEQEHKILKEYNTKSFSQIFTGNEIDIPEHIICALCPDIDLKKLREYSYANIFYKYIRSTIVHEYSVSPFASTHPMTQRNTFVSYNNNLNHPYRRICFHFNNIINVTESIATEIALIIDNTPLNKPKEWWLDGVKMVT